MEDSRQGHGVPRLSLHRALGNKEKAGSSWSYPVFQKRLPSQNQGSGRGSGVGFPLSKLAAPQVQAALPPQQDPGAAQWHWAMSSPEGCHRVPGAAGPPGLVGQSQTLSDPLLPPPLWSPLLLSPSLPRAAPPWKQEWKVSRAQPAAPTPSIQRPRAAWSSEGDPPIPAGCGYL